MPDVTIGIVAHTGRSEPAHKLMHNVRAAYMSVDNGIYGCVANHVRVWKRLAKANTEWVLALEDDAVPGILMVSANSSTQRSL